MRTFWGVEMTLGVPLDVAFAAVRMSTTMEVFLPLVHFVETAAGKVVSNSEQVVLVSHGGSRNCLTCRVCGGASIEVYRTAFEIVIVVYEYRRVTGYHIVRVDLVDGEVAQSSAGGAV